jgi:hypothetical protein
MHLHTGIHTTIHPSYLIPSNYRQPFIKSSIFFIQPFYLQYSPLQMARPRNASGATQTVRGSLEVHP